MQGDAPEHTSRWRASCDDKTVTKRSGRAAAISRRGVLYSWVGVMGKGVRRGAQYKHGDAADEDQ